MATYRATIRGDRLEWDGDIPEQARTQSPFSVVVIIPDPALRADEARGRRMADILERIAAEGAVAIGDAVQWQRDEREDRELPGRS